MNNSIYADIAERTNGEIYIGVVGPVRCGKSTFIKKFMETTVIPNIEGEYERQRARDELPQSAGGRTVMTSEPKFVPDEAVEIHIGDSATMKVKMIDCVGYLIPGILGDTEDGEARRVHTPWQDEPLPFEDAAEMGTRRVIEDHSTIGILVTCDGSFGEIPRENYVEAEERIAGELKSLGKPFAIVLNSSSPESPEAEELAVSLENKYKAPVALVNCLDLNDEDIAGILELIVREFPVREITVEMPVWTGVLDGYHWLRRALTESISSAAAGISKVGDVSAFKDSLERGINSELEERGGESAAAAVSSVDMGRGSASVKIKLPECLLYKIIGEMTGISMSSEAEMLSALRSLSEMKREYDRFVEAIDDVNEKGYGIVMPTPDDLTLDEPEIVKQAGGYGVRLRASAPSIHMIKAGIETELNPIVGTEQQSEELVKFLLDEFKENPQSIWDTNLFGKSIYELVNEGLHAKLEHMPDDAREKLGETLSKVINEGASGLICIIL